MYFFIYLFATGYLIAFEMKCEKKDKNNYKYRNYGQTERKRKKKKNLHKCGMVASY